MLFLTDTCFWMHIKNLAENSPLDLRPYLLRFKWGITEEIGIELERHKIGPFLPANQAFIVPISDDELKEGLRRYPHLEYFDLADQTLFFTAIRDQSIILTDDGDLYLECITSGIESLRLPHFCLLLTREQDLDKTDVYYALRYWKQGHYYAKKELKKWHSELAKIQ